jgi:hypothetical protein
MVGLAGPLERFVVAAQLGHEVGETPPVGVAALLGGLGAQAVAVLLDLAADALASGR